jgi:hypothetical protein
MRSDGIRTFGQGWTFLGSCWVDQAAAGWFGERDDLVGRDLMWSHPPHSLKPGFALFDGDFRLPLGAPILV